ncbi:hypothetical protein ACJQWK_10611 [Exserohilum turcicum]
MFKNTHQPLPDERVSAITDWLMACQADGMASPTPPSESVSSSHDSRSSRHSAYKSRTSRPSKRILPQTYRIQNISYAGIFIENLAELPPEIERRLRHILKAESLEDILGTAEHESQQATHVEKFLNESRYNVRGCLFEADLKDSLSRLVRELAQDNLRCHASRQLWNPDLKPLPPHMAQPDDESGAPTSHSVLPDLDSQSASGLPGPNPFLRSYTASTAYTTSSEAADPFHISTPKPDIVVGLDDRAFTLAHRIQLAKHQSLGSLLIDTHIEPMGLHFPFLIAETKGLSLNGGLVAAQNEAAISAACMLKS